MPENKENNGSAVDDQNVSDDKKVVPVRAYEEVTRDMHKEKARRKELEASLNELQAQLKLQEEAEMQKQEQWKELYQKTKAESEQEKQRAEQEKNRYMRSVKMSALKSELGGKIKDEYLTFANLDAITVNEHGAIDADSVLSVANQFRKEHGQLIPKSDNANITGHSPSNLDNFNPKPINQMTHDEKVALLKQIHANKQ